MVRSQLAEDDPEKLLKAIAENEHPQPQADIESMAIAAERIRVSSCIFWPFCQKPRAFTPFKSVFPSLLREAQLRGDFPPRLKKKTKGTSSSSTAFGRVR
jgi:hypothetical protein